MRGQVTVEEVAFVEMRQAAIKRAEHDCPVRGTTLHQATSVVTRLHRPGAQYARSAHPRLLRFGSVLSVSIVTPSFNQAPFLPECISSVANQSLPPIEHLIFDPGSTDGSREIAASASSTTLIAEPDSGQADAVARGLRMGKGDVLGWLNSDDIYASNDVFEKVVARFEASDYPDIVYGRGTYIDAEGEHIRDAYVNEDPASLGIRLQHEVGILQPTVFFRRQVFDIIEPPLEHLHFAMDYDMWIRAAKAGLRFAFLPEVLASGRYYEDNKTMGMRAKSYAEVLDVTQEHFGAIHVRWAKRLAENRLSGADGVLVQGTDLKPADVDAETVKILRAHNYAWSARDALGTYADAEPYTETLQFMQKHGMGLEHHARPVADGTQGPGIRTYKVDTTTWSFDRSWVDAEFAKAKTRLDELRANRKSDTAVIVGNGPSLNDTDLSLLDGTDVFVSNFAHLKQDLFERSTYLSVVNNLVAEQGAPLFNAMDSVTKFAPWWLGYCLAPSHDMVFLPSIGHAEFSTDLMKNISWRHTVSFWSMQLAYGLGFQRVALIGFDHSYRQDAKYVEGETIDQDGDDHNHFDPNYFKAKQWHAADVDNMEAMYRLADAAYKADGREIVNCTVGGHLELFPRAELGAYL